MSVKVIQSSRVFVFPWRMKHSCTVIPTTVVKHSDMRASMHLAMQSCAETQRWKKNSYNMKECRREKSWAILTSKKRKNERLFSNFLRHNLKKNLKFESGKVNLAAHLKMTLISWWANGISSRGRNLPSIQKRKFCFYWHWAGPWCLYEFSRPY